jgi:hypothetical protein
MTTKQVDSKGRITLDKSYANSTMLLDEQEDGTLILRPAVTVPAREAWLWKNKKALKMVLDGVEQARQGKFIKGPNLKADAAFVKRIKDADE